MGVSRIIGLDIGTSAVKMVEIDRSKKGMRLDFVGLAPLPEGAIVNKSIKKPDAIRSAIRALLNNSKTRTKLVATSLAGQSIIIKHVTMTSMTDAQLEKQIGIEAEAYIPFDLKEVNIDFFIMGDRPEKEGYMDVVLVAAKKETMNEHIDLISGLNLTPVVVDVDPFALEVMFEWGYQLVQDELVALVDIGASTTTINILKLRASQYTKDISIGGESLTQEIMKQFDVDHTRAENIKRGAQLEKIKIPPSQLRKTFQRSVDAIVSEVHKVFEYYQQNIGYDPIPKIFLSGGASRTYGLVSTMEADLGIPVEIVDPFLNIGAIDPKVFDMEYLRYIGPSMAVAVGLALRDEEDKETKD